MKCFLLQDKSTCRFFPEISSENDILDLHELCMTFGLHHIQTKTIEHGRSLMESIMSSLNYHRNPILVSALALDQDSIFFSLQDFLPATITDEALDNFLMQCDADFLCIENTPALTCLPWFKKFMQGLEEYKIGSQMPIILVSFH